MSASHDIEFYIRTDRNRVIEITGMAASLEDLLHVPDVYVRYFLLTNIDLPAVDGSRELLGRLRMFFHEFKESDPIVEVNFSKNMIELIRRKIKVMDIESFVGCMSELDFSLLDLKHYRKFFGYSQIYGLYKSMIKRVFSCKYNHNELGLTMTLLDNEALCFRRLLPIFSRLTTYVKSKLIDKNIVACCVALKAVLAYIPNAMREKDDYVISLISYLVGVMSQHSSFAFINENDADEIISTIDVLVRYDFSVDVCRISLGMLREIIFNLDVLLENRTTIYEEAFAIICMLEMVPLVYRLCRFGNTKYDFASVYGTVQKAQISKMNYISDEEWMHVNDRFLKAKYMSLDSLYMEGNPFDRVTFYNDINGARHASEILGVIDALRSEMLWSDMIMSACCPDKQEEYLRFLFDESFMEKKEHLVYISLFVDAISDRPDLLLYSGYLLLKSKVPEAEEKWKMLSDMYMRDIWSEDQRLVRLRCIISDHVNGLASQEKRCMFIKLLLDRLNGVSKCFNASVVSFLHLFLANDTRIPSEVSRSIGSYLIECVEFEASKSEKEDFDGLEEVYVCVAARAFSLSVDISVLFRLEPLLRNYHFFVVSCLVWRKGKLSEEHIEVLKEQMLYFLFKASREQIDELGLLVEKRRSRFGVKFDELYADPKERDEPESNGREC